MIDLRSRLIDSRNNDIIPFHTLKLWTVATAVSQSSLQILGFDLAVIRQGVARRLVDQGTELRGASSRRPVCEVPQGETLPGLTVKLGFQNSYACSFVRKIEANLDVKSTFSDQSFIESVKAVSRGHQHKSV
jgi:hypothetical protein